MALFIDRKDAGEKLAQMLNSYQDQPDVIVLALPRGGVPVGYQIARSLRVPFDIFLVRKLGVPGHEELAMGAIASGGVRVLNPEVIQSLHIPHDVINWVARREQAELERREQAYRGNRARPNLAGKRVILVDDGLATGASMRAAVEGARQHQPARVIVAVPTGAPDVCREFQRIADDVVCATTPEPFRGVGMWYENFSQTSDDEVRSLLDQAAEDQRAVDQQSAAEHRGGRGSGAGGSGPFIY